MTIPIVSIFLLGCSLEPSEPISGYAVVFRDKAKDTDLVKIRSGGTCHRDPNTERMLLRVSKPQEIIDLIHKLEVYNPHGKWGCGCCGDLTMEFYKQSELLCSISIHHGYHLRWRNGEWGTDVIMTEKYAEWLCDWLSARGITEMRKMRNEHKRLEQQHPLDPDSLRDLGK